MKLASSDARNSTAFATSSGTPSQPMGWYSHSSFRYSSRGIFLALKKRGIAHETLRKYITMLKFVVRECRNTVVDDMTAKGKLVIGADHKDLFALEAEEVKRILDGAR
jgi:hypothetical protein